MKIRHFGVIFILALLLFWAMSGCDKEKIVESTEYVHDIEYRELPPDTIIVIDTLYMKASSVINNFDTVYVVDTIRIRDSIIVHSTDTVISYDTLIQVTYVHDTVRIIQNHYDTTIIIDTVQVQSYRPNKYLAYSALQYYTDELVLDFIEEEFGYSDGWIFYLSAFQLELTQQSTGVYDIYGYIDYWTTDWSGYYPLEFYWEMIYTGGDPANPNNWEIGEPLSASTAHPSGIRVVQGARPTIQNLR